MTQTDTLAAKLKKLEIGDQLKLANGSASHSQVMAWYRAARKQGIKVTIRTMPDGIRLWRIQ